MKTIFLNVQHMTVFVILFAGLCTFTSCENDVISEEMQSESVTKIAARGLFDITLDASQEYQTMDGFGFTQEEEVTWSMTEPYRSQVMEMLFDKEKGAGFSILRHKIGAGYSKPTIEPQKGVWNYTADEREIWYLKKALEYGVDKIMGTVWTPPAWMKTTGNLTGGGYLKQENYQDFAEYLTKYVQIYAQRGIPIWGISPANEPEYAAQWDSCLWPASAFRNFIVNYWGPELARQGVDLNIILGETAWWSELKSIATLEDPQGSQLVDVVATHYYGNLPIPLLFAKKHNKPVWVTETSDTKEPFDVSVDNGVWWASRVHKSITSGKASAFLYWRGPHTTNSDQCLIRCIDESPYIIPSKRFYALAQYSRFIRPGYVRIEINKTPALGVSMSAYKNPATGQIVIVAVNSANRTKSIELQLNNTAASSFQAYVTDEVRDITLAESIAAEANKVMLTLNSKSVTTFVSDESVSF